jgi:hypothetical protein
MDDILSFWIIYFFIGIVVALVIVFIKFFVKQTLPYYKNNNFISPAELSFFKVLEQAIGERYYIFPQVNLASLVKINAKGRDWWRYFERINRKSVDFVLAEKASCKPALIIELDDSSHGELRRQERDDFVNKVFAAAGLPILHVAYQNRYSTLRLKDEIDSKIAIKF